MGQGHDSFPPRPGRSPTFHAGTGADNVTPNDVEIKFNIPFRHREHCRRAQATGARCLGSAQAEIPVDWTLSAVPYLTPRGELVDALSAAIRDVIARAPVSAPPRDLRRRFIAEICNEVVEFEPGEPRPYTKLNEHIDLAAIEPLREIYLRLLARLLAS